MREKGKKKKKGQRVAQKGREGREAERSEAENLSVSTFSVETNNFIGGSHQARLAITYSSTKKIISSDCRRRKKLREKERREGKK